MYSSKLQILVVMKWLCNFNAQIWTQSPWISLYTQLFRNRYTKNDLKQLLLLTPSKGAPYPPAPPALLDHQNMLKYSKKTYNRCFIEIRKCNVHTQRKVFWCLELIHQFFFLDKSNIHIGPRKLSLRKT